LNFEKLSTGSYSNRAQRNQFKESDDTAQLNHQIKVIMRLKGFTLANSAISVWYASKEQRLEVILFQGNFTQYTAVRLARFPYAGPISGLAGLIFIHHDFLWVRKM
jgi:hypothetical protein